MYATGIVNVFIAQYTHKTLFDKVPIIYPIIRQPYLMKKLNNVDGLVSIRMLKSDCFYQDLNNAFEGHQITLFHIRLTN